MRPFWNQSGTQDQAHRTVSLLAGGACALFCCVLKSETAERFVSQTVHSGTDVWYNTLYNKMKSAYSHIEQGVS